MIKKISNSVSHLMSISNQLNASFSNILYKQKHSIQFIILNSPQTLNSLSLPMIMSLQENLQQFNKNSEIKAVIFKGQGDKAFCAGGDVKDLFYAKQSQNKEKMKILDEFFRQEFIADYMASQMKPIIIAIWNGIVMGGGVGISIHSKIRIATEKSVFAMPEAKLGFFTDVGVSAVLNKLKNNIGLYLGLTGVRLKGEELLQCGIANYFVSSNQVDKLEEDLINSINMNSSEKDIYQIIEKYNQKSQQSSTFKFEDNIKKLFSIDQSFEQFYQNLQQDQSEFGKNTFKLIQEASPVSVRLIFQQIKSANQLSLKQNFERDFRITQRFVSGNDFFEGIRSILIDKDNKPKWQHLNALEVTQEEINKYFEQLPADVEWKYNF